MLELAAPMDRPADLTDLTARPGGALVQQASSAKCLLSQEVTQSHGAGGLLSSDLQVPNQ